MDRIDLPFSALLFCMFFLFFGSLSHRVKLKVSFDGRWKEGVWGCVLGKCLNRSSVNAVQLVLVLAKKEHLMSFSLEVGQWESLLFSLKLEKERAVVISIYPDKNWEEVTQTYRGCYVSVLTGVKRK